jgi:hypothetical protein
MEDINKAMEGVEGINARKRFTVRIGGKYAFRDTNSVKRYSLSDKPFYFYSEVQARECFRLMGRGAEIESEIVQNN